jgi:bcr-type benzoyl-CoA reductase subunit C
MQDSVQQARLEWIADPYRGWSTRFAGRRAFGYLCTYAPLELLHCAGFAPVRLMQSTSAIRLADAHLPSFSCALARTTTERFLQGDLDFLEGVVFTHTCDTLQCLADIWRMAKPSFRVVTFSLPTVFNGSASREYVIRELRRVANELGAKFGARVTVNALRASIATYNQQRRLLARLHERAAQLMAEQVWSLTIAGMLMPVDEHNALLESILSAEEAGGRSARGPGILLAGAVLDDALIPRLVDELGAYVAGDDLCTGSRYWDALTDESLPPFEALAERYLRRVNCPAKHTELAARAEHLLRQVRLTGARGVVFVLPKFCDPHAFDHVPLARVLDGEGVPHTYIETDVMLPAAQIRTRLQAFLEMLRSTRSDAGYQERRDITIQSHKDAG